MNKPNNYDETQASGSYTPINEGGHHLMIKNVEETTSKNGKPMLVVYLDTTKKDSQPEFFKNEFRNDIRPEKKWPNAGTKYIVIEDNDGNCTKGFKTFVTSFENSNNCEAVWGDGFAAQFKNKKIGGVYGKAENEYNGKVTMRTELFWFCSDDKVDGATIPSPRYLNNNSSSSNDFMNVPDTDESDLPF